MASSCQPEKLTRSNDTYTRPQDPLQCGNRSPRRRLPRPASLASCEGRENQRSPKPEAADDDDNPSTPGNSTPTAEKIVKRKIAAPPDRTTKRNKVDENEKALLDMAAAQLDRDGDGGYGNYHPTVEGEGEEVEYGSNEEDNNTKSLKDSFGVISR